MVHRRVGRPRGGRSRSGGRHRGGRHRLPGSISFARAARQSRRRGRRGRGFFGRLKKIGKKALKSQLGQELKRRALIEAKKQLRRRTGVVL